MSDPARLIVAHVDAETGFSGGEVQVFLLMEGLRAHGHRCVLLAPNESRADLEAEKRGFETRPVRMRSDLDIRSVVEMARILRDLAPDVVHLHTGRATWLGALAARAAERPAITTRRMDRRVRRGWRTRLVYGRLTERVAAISPAVGRCLEDGGVDPGKIELVPSTIDPARIAVVKGREATRASLDVGPQDVVLLTLASLVPRKGIDVLIDACAGLSRREVACVCLVAGEGPERERLESRARAVGLGTRLRFLGQRNDVGDLLAACDVFVLPARREGLGVAALEAMAAARPVVASAVGGLQEAVVDGETGLLVSPDDPEALCGALERLVQDSSLRARLGRSGPARISTGFLPEQMVASYERIYRAIVASRSPKA